jgi:hypothetical protein
MKRKRAFFFEKKNQNFCSRNQQAFPEGQFRAASK